jgi:uncharacterized protein
MDQNAFCSMTKATELLVYRGDEAAVRQKLSQGMSVNSYDSTSRTSLLMWASSWGWTDLVKMLIEQGAEFKTYRNCEGSTALMDASFHGRIETVKLLLESGAKLKHKDNAGATAMDWAVRSRNWKILEILIDAGGKYEIPVPMDIDWEQVIPIDPEIEETNDDDLFDE